jgi:ribosome-associated protein
VSPGEGPTEVPGLPPAAEIAVEFLRSSGPGGQNVNKVETAVRVRFDAARSPSLDPEVRARLLALAGRRATAAGEILIVARRHRTRERNREEALARLAALIERARRPPAPRRPTRPSRAARARRRVEKARRGETKRGRRSPAGEE